MYVREVIIAGKTIEINKYYTYQYKSKKITRGVKENTTSKAQEKINNKLAEKKLRLLLNTNFQTNDYHLVLTYRKEDRPNTKEDMQEDIKKFLRKLRSEYKKLNMKLKYVHVAEVGVKGAMHHHLVINNIDPSIITSIWKKGRCKFNTLDSSGQYKDLAHYLLKSKNEISKKKYSTSRNLKKPIIKKTIIKKSDTFKNETIIPKKYKNYYVDKTSTREGVNSLGYSYFSYTLIRIE